MNQYTLTQIPTKSDYQVAIESSVKEFEEYFGVSLGQKICLIFLNSRQQFDDIVGRPTLPFETAFSSENLIFMMAEDVFEQESNKKFNYQNNLLTVRHEVCHKFFRRLVWRTQPVWLNEGVAIYLSGQYKNKKPVDKFTNFLMFDSKNAIDDLSVYQESGFVVEKLINKFGKEKFINFLTTLRGIPDNSLVYSKFQEAFGLELNYDNINKL